METRAVYKKTELGWIPEEWDVQNIGSICDVKGGKRLPKGDSLVDEDTGYPYIRVADMFMGGVKTNALKFVPVETVSKIKNYIINKEDLFISVAGTLGIVGKIPAILDGANLTENADKLTNITIDRHFLFFVLSSDIIQGVIQKEATINALPKLAIQKIKTFLLPIPPLPEQQKIAEILTTVDDKISSIADRIQQTEQLKKGLMEKLLTEGIGHTEFKDTEIGRIPVSWEISQLQEVSKKIWIGLVTTMTTNYSDVGVPLIRNNNIKENKVSKDNLIYLNQSFAIENNTRRLKTGDIVSVHTGDICTSAIIDDDLNGAHGFATLNTTVKSTILNQYLCWYLNSDLAKKQAYAVATGDGRGNLNMKDFVKANGKI